MRVYGLRKKEICEDARSNNEQCCGMEFRGGCSSDRIRGRGAAGGDQGGRRRRIGHRRRDQLRRRRPCHFERRPYGSGRRDERAEQI